MIRRDQRVDPVEAWRADGERSRDALAWALVWAVVLLLVATGCALAVVLT